MKNEKNNQSKSRAANDIAVGVSSAAGATMGAAAGSFTAAHVYGAERQNPSEQPIPVPEPQPTPQPEPQPTPQPEPQPQPQPQPQPAPTPAPEPPAPDGPEIEVLNFERTVNEDGTVTELAVLSVDGTIHAVMDIDGDGEIDLVGIDMNNDGLIDEDEIICTTGDGLSMAPIHANLPDTDYVNDHLADTGDYTNNADVSDYMA